MTLWPAALGLNLWLLTIGVPALLGPRPRGPVLVLLPLAPLLLLWLLRPAARGARLVLLLGVPLATFLPVLDGPLAHAMLHPRPVVALQAAVLIGYLWTTSRALAPAPSTPPATTLPDSDVPWRWRRRVQIYRLLVAYSIVAPALLLYALLLDPETQRAFRLSFETPERIAGVQAAALSALALLWTTAFHFFLAGPLVSHLLHDRTTAAQIATLRRQARTGRPRPQFYIAMVLAVLSMAMLIHRSLFP
ncbi:MAG: hypothetical protein RMK29_09720 [Myxococcales bacterium]|nr:hypothetical protein [Myxococcota bacterium]MDW8281979.1 hypothetical protein [Myxococcales bacterium]